MIASAEFLDQWTLEDMPACDEGMALLEQFAQVHTEEWKYVLENRLFEFGPQAAGLHNGLWILFADHCNGCDKCNEC